MKRFLIIVLVLIGSSSTKAQINEFGLFLGGSNFIGDVGETTYIDPNKPAFGIIYKWNRSQRHTWRFSYTQSRVVGDDSNSEMKSREQRNFKFKNDIQELSAGLEFDFFNFDLHDSDPQSTLFVSTGLSAIRYDGLYFLNGEAKSSGRKIALAVPMILGFKGRLYENFIIAFEFGPRFTLQDDIDGSKPRDRKHSDRKFGNLGSSDWVVFSGITLTYTFGKKPCFCAD